jgi:hypothetical protein
VVFRFAIKVEKAAVGRARNSGEEQDTMYDDQTERGGGRKGKVRLSFSSCGHGRRCFHSLQVPVCRIHLDEMKWLCRKGPEIA